jgi:hypothetical protein
MLLARPYRLLNHSADLIDFLRPDYFLQLPADNIPGVQDAELPFLTYSFANCLCHSHHVEHAYVIANDLPEGLLGKLVGGPFCSLLVFQNSPRHCWQPSSCLTIPAARKLLKNWKATQGSQSAPHSVGRWSVPFWACPRFSPVCESGASHCGKPSATDGQSFRHLLV